jgi:hypothetical protein
MSDFAERSDYERSFGLRISSLERLEPLDFPAVRFDTE